MSYKLGELILEGGVPSPRYFNGRLLTAEDLKLEQDAQRLWRMRLGQAIEPGVRFGMDVRAIQSGDDSIGSATVQVEAGLAISRDGSMLYLPSGIEVMLWQDHSAPPDGAFGPRRPPSPVETPQVALLVMEPGAADGERTLRSGYGGFPTGTDVAYRTEGVRFTLIPCRAALGEADTGTLQNRIAHLCFGTAARLGAPWQPFPDPEGLRHLAPESELSGTQVPIAVIGRLGQRLLFADPWPVRAVDHPDAIARQFQAQVEALRQALPDCSTVRAKDHFRYLPPSGWLPGGPGGFQSQSFFRSMTVTRLDLDPAFVGHWIDQVRGADPIDLQNPPPLWLWQPKGSDRFLFLRRERARSVTYANTATVIVSLAPEGRKAILPVAASVWAANEEGIRFEGEPMGDEYVLWGLSPGLHTVWAQLPGGRPTCHHLRLSMGEMVRLLLRVESTAPPPAPDVPEPPASGPGAWLGPYDTVTVRVSALTAGMLPSETDWLLADSPPKAVESWLEDWARWIRLTHPDMPVDVTNMRVLRNATPGSPGDDGPPDALVVYGNGGAWLPLIGEVKAAKPEPKQPDVPQEGILEMDALQQAAISVEPPPKKLSWVRRLGRWLTRKKKSPEE